MVVQQDHGFNLKKKIKMRKLENLELQSINGGSVSGVINGVCGALAVSGALGWISFTIPAGVTLAVACVANSYAGGQGWW
jgi:hypothetical protein